MTLMDLPNASITILQDDPTIIDSDSDMIDDATELANGLDPNDPTDAGQDKDGDGLTNLGRIPGARWYTVHQR